MHCLTSVDTFCNSHKVHVHGSFVLQPVKKKVVKGKKKKVAAAPLKVKKLAEQKKVVNPLFEKRPKNFGIGKYFFLLVTQSNSGLSV